MTKKIALSLLALLAVFLIYVAVQPADYVVVREIEINAPAEQIFPYLNNSQLAEKWGPWTETDPSAKMIYSGPEEGVGARTSWDSTGPLGTGSATIVESVPNERVGTRLEYTKPMSMTQDAVYSIKASGDKSVVAWSVRGQNNYIGRLMCVFMDMDKMIGDMFEKGLTNLKTLVEEQE